MHKCKECEHCGNLDLFENVKCSVCGEVRYAKPEIDAEKVANFIGRVKLQCSNCVYCRLYTWSDDMFICLNYNEDEGFSSYYDLVKSTHVCSKFIPNEAVAVK